MTESCPKTNRITSRSMLSSTAVFALMFASSPAQAQNSYNAIDPTVASGVVTFDRTSVPNVETYTIASDTAVLDFAVDGSPGIPIDFQLAGTTAIYENAPGITDFTVLNRIIPSDPAQAIQFNGTVISQIQGAPATPGGSVWFYSPGGIILSPTAAFDVGNVLLTTGDPTGGTGIISDPNQFSISSVADGNAAVNIQAGAQITASNAGSYVALVAPAIIQSGTVSTNGSAAYVAAEQSTLTFAAGLFNITTAVGSNANGNVPLVHEGTTRFIDDAGQRRAYLVAVPKNDAITMLIQGGGQLGFDTAAGVTVDNGVVVLGAGASQVSSDVAFLDPNPSFLSDISIEGGNIIADVDARATNETALSANADIQMSGDLTLFGTNNILLETASFDVDLDSVTIFAPDIALNAIGLGNISTIGDVSVNVGSAENALGEVVGGTLSILADGGGINIGGDLNVQAGVTANPPTMTNPAVARGSVVSFQTSNSGSIAVIGGSQVFANSTGGSVFVGPAGNIGDGGDGFGGTINVSLDTGQIAFGGNTVLNARGNGGASGALVGQSGDGFGGDIVVLNSGGALSFASSVSFDSSGFGGQTLTSTDVSGGSGFGGNISISSVNGGSTSFVTWSNIANGVAARALGPGNNAGSGFGGDVSIVASGGSIDAVNSFVEIRGYAESGEDNSAILGQGGDALILADGGVISFSNTLNIDVAGFGVFQSSPDTGQNGGDAIGGVAVVEASNSGAIDVGQNLNLNTAAFGGDANGGVTGVAGDALGGTATVSATVDSAITVGTNIQIDSSGQGGTSLTVGSGGRGEGGISELLQSQNSAIVVDQQTSVSSSGTGGGSQFRFGGVGIGGLARVNGDDGGALVSNSGLFLIANGSGGTSSGLATAGRGTGGSAQIGYQNGSALVVDGLLIVDADGIGGISPGGDTSGGEGLGGDALITAANNGAINISGQAVVSTDGFGQSGTGTGVGSSGIGGTVQILAQAAIEFGQDLSISAFGRGGAGSDNSAIEARGGTLALQADGASSSLVVLGNVDMFAQGLANTANLGQDGATGNGGSSIASAINGGTLTIDGTAVTSATATGGAANGGSTGLGGGATGGNAQFVASGTGQVLIGQGVTASADGIGGNGLAAGSDGGDGTGGTASISQATGGLVQISVQAGQSGVISADGRGGTNRGGGDGIGGIGIGGDARFVSNDGTTRLAGDLLVSADGIGGGTDGGLAGGDGFGGLANIGADTGLTQIDGIVTLTSDATGGAGLSDSASGGNATGGQALIGSIGIGAIDLGSTANVSSDAAGGISGLGGSGGDAIAGTSQIFATAGTVTLTGNATIMASGTGGNGGVPGSDGGDGTGGFSGILANGGGAVSSLSELTLLSFGRGGTNTGGGPAVGGIGTGGATNVIANNGTINVGGTTRLRSNGVGGQADGGNMAGTGNGGAATISVTTGQIDLTTLFISSTANSGNALSPGVSGGDAVGGASTLEAVGTGTVNITQFASVVSSGIGSGGSLGGASGGVATGGAVTIRTTSGGTIAFADRFAAGASGSVSSDPLNAVDAGGTGNGGSINLITTGGSIIGTSDISLNARGTGGEGLVSGGDGTGGQISVFAQFGLIDLSSGTSDSFVSTFGTGGDAITERDSGGNIIRGGGTGGTGTGGEIFLFAGVPAPVTGELRLGNIITTDFFGDVRGSGSIGGQGADGAPGQDGGRGGDASAGLFFVGSNFEAGIVRTGDIAATNNTVAGNGGLGGLADSGGQFGNGGNGGNAVGRQLLVGSRGTGSMTTTGFAIVGDLTLSNNANGGDGGNAQGGSAVGGTGGDVGLGAEALGTPGAFAAVQSRSIPVTFGDAILTANATAGNGGVSAAGIRNTGGISASFFAGLSSNQETGNGQRGNISGGDFVANAISSGGLGANDVEADAALGAAVIFADSGDIDLLRATLNGGGNLPAGPGFEPGLLATDGIVQIAGDIAINSAGDFAVSPSGTGEINASNLTVTAGGGNAPPLGLFNDEINIDGDVLLTLGGDFLFPDPIEFGGSLTVVARSIAVGDVTAGTGIDFNSVTGAGDIVTGSLLTSGDIIINGGGSVDILSATTMASPFGSGGGLLVTATNDLTIGDADTVGLMDLDIGGLATITGLLAAPSIFLRSADIDIGVDGGLGNADTDDLFFTARAPNQPIFFGGDGSGGGYNLSALEATKLRSRTISFDADQVPGAASADIAVRDFTLQGSLAGASANLIASDLLIGSPGVIRITGAVLIENAGVDDAIEFAADRIEVVTDLGGSIRVENDTGGLSGSLLFEADNIAVGTGSLLGQLAVDPRFAGRNDLAALPDGSGRPQGNLEASEIVLDSSDTIIIQNSNTSDLRGGFTTGQAGLILDTETSIVGAIDVVINGRIEDGAGGFQINEDTRNDVRFDNGPSQGQFFASGATVNGCLLSGGDCGPIDMMPIVPSEPETGVSDTIASDVREIADEDEEERSAELKLDGGKSSPIAPNIPVVSTTQLGATPDIDEPITGSGNPNLIGREFLPEPPLETDSSLPGGA